VKILVNRINENPANVTLRFETDIVRIHIKSFNLKHKENIEMIKENVVYCPKVF